MSGQAAELAQHLARQAEAVCRHYLSNGRRHGRYWIVGDVHDTPGRSLYVRLAGPQSGPGAAGKWTDSATGEHGDLIDLIAGNRGLGKFPRRMPGGAPLSELAARIFREQRCDAARAAQLAGGRPPAVSRRRVHHRHAGRGLSPRARHHRASRLAVAALSPGALVPARRQRAPRVLAGLARRRHRSRRPHHRRASHLARPRASRQGAARRSAPGARPSARQWRALPRPSAAEPASADVLLAGEGIETVLSLKSVLPGLPMIAALSANHLAALELAPMLARLYVARDRDAAGRMAAERLQARGSAADIEVRDLVPVCGDFNEDLCRLGPGVAPGASARSARAGRCPALPRPAGFRLSRALPVACAACGSGRKGAGIVHPADLPDRSRGPRVRPSRAAICQGRTRPAMADGDYFPPPAKSRLCIAKQNSRRPPSSAALRPLAGKGRRRGANRLRPRRAIAVKAAMGAARPATRRSP